MNYNKRLIKWYKRIGFVEEGREREGCWSSGGWHDIVTFSMLEDDWKALKNRAKKRDAETEGGRGMESMEETVAGGMESMDIK